MEYLKDSFDTGQIEDGFSNSKSIKGYRSSYSLPDPEEHETSYNVNTSHAAVPQEITTDNSEDLPWNDEQLRQDNLWTTVILTPSPKSLCHNFHQVIECSFFLWMKRSKMEKTSQLQSQTIALLEHSRVPNQQEN